MKHKIIKKTILYRLLAYGIALLIGFYSPMSINISFLFVSISEGISLATYYLYEFFWDAYSNKQKIKAGMRFFTQLAPDKDKYGWYKVIEDLGDGKMVIEVE